MDMNLYSYFTYFMVSLGVVQYERSAETPLSTYDFDENWCSGSCIFLQGLHESFPIISIFFYLILIKLHNKRCLKNILYAYNFHASGTV